MKKHQQTDRIIKDKMERHSMEVPMHLFAGIADALDAEATATSKPQQSPWRKRGIWMLGLLILVVAGNGIWYMTSNDSSANNSTSELSTVLEKENSASNIDEIGNGELVKSDEVTSEEILDNKNNTTSLISNNTNVKASVITSIENNNIGGSNNSFVAKSAATTKNNSFTETTPKDVFTPKGTTQNKSELPSVTTDVNTSSLNPTVSNPTSEASNASANILTTATSSENPIAAELNNASISTTKKLEREVFNLPKLNQKANKTHFSTPYRIALEPTCGLKPDGSKIKFITSVDAFFSPDYANQMLEYKSNDFREYAQRRTETENPFYSFNTGVRVNFLTEFGWAIRTGLVYTQINEILKTQYTEIVTTIDNNGNVIGTTEGLRDVNIRNKYKMVDIPLVIGYEVPMKKFDMNVNGGVYLNLMSKQSGAFFSPLEDKVVYFTEGHPDDYDIFKNNIGLSIFMGLGFNFDLTNALNAKNRMQLIVEPHARFYPKSFTLDNYILNQKYFSTGVMIGLRRDL